MKRKLALLIAAVMTVAMVPATAFASTKLTAVDEITVGTDKIFTSRVELRKGNDQVDIDEDKNPTFDVTVTLTNGTFAYVDDDDDNAYVMDTVDKDGCTDNKCNHYNPDMEYLVDTTPGVLNVDVLSDTKAVVTLDTATFNRSADKEGEACVLPLIVKAGEVGDVVAKFTSNVKEFKTASEVIATVQTGKVTIETEGVKTFVEDETDDNKELKEITIKELTPDVLDGGSIKLKLSGNWKFTYEDADGYKADPVVKALNEDITGKINTAESDEDEMVIDFIGTYEKDMLTDITISNVFVQPAKKCKAGDVATITVSSLAKSKEFSNVKLEVAKMVKEAVTYSVEDDDLPVIWAGAYNDDENTLEVSIEENTGDILNTSRKATFTFPEGIEVVDIANVADLKVNKTGADKFKYEIDQNVVTIWNYAKPGEESSAKTDLGIKFILNAAPTFSGDVNVTLGGQFDDVTLKVATVKAPYTITAKTS